MKNIQHWTELSLECVLRAVEESDQLGKYCLQCGQLKTMQWHSPAHCTLKTAVVTMWTAAVNHVNRLVIIRYPYLKTQKSAKAISPGNIKSWSTTRTLDRRHHQVDSNDDQRNSKIDWGSRSLEGNHMCHQPPTWRRALRTMTCYWMSKLSAHCYTDSRHWTLHCHAVQHWFTVTATVWGIAAVCLAVKLEVPLLGRWCVLNHSQHVSVHCCLASSYTNIHTNHVLPSVAVSTRKPS